ncbi:MAG TPA: endonuclease V [Jiangellaceae bacterium]|nr:endonuclease V [Jiangellaceae bacterium]
MSRRVEVSTWPVTSDELMAAQEALAAGPRPPLWRPSPSMVVAGCFACLPRGESGAGAAGDPVWAAAAAYRGRRCVGRAAVTGTASGPYVPGLLALRIGAPLESAVRALPETPDVVLVDATGYDHPRRAGLAFHLGAVLDLPTVGVTHRTLLATGDWPSDVRAATSPLVLDGEVVGYWLRTRAGRRPVAVHAGWRTAPETAVQVVLTVAQHRTPAPLREARRVARVSRASTGHRLW